MARRAIIGWGYYPLLATRYTKIHKGEKLQITKYKLQTNPKLQITKVLRMDMGSGIVLGEGG
jgi:hypothetical protein